MTGSYTYSDVDGGWSSVGDERFSDGRADFTSLAMDSDGTPYIAYTDYTTTLEPA